jgi:hypothetical protein
MEMSITSKNPAAAAAPTKPNAPQAPSAKPGVKEPKAKKEKKPKVERIDYPVGDEKLVAVPADYDPKKHKPLRRKDFKDEAVFVDMQADRAERAAKRLREEAVAIRAGGGKDKGKAKKLIAMQKRMAEMQAQLEADGVDVAALLASVDQK